MTALSLMTARGQYLLSGVLFLVVTAQLALCLYRRLCRADPGRRAADWTLFALLLAAVSCTASAAAGKSPGPLGPVPWLALLLPAAVLLVRVGVCVRGEYLRAREQLSPDSVRRALDDLNAGICFADGTGRPVLINRVMGELALSLLGGYPRTVDELLSALDGPGVTRPEGTEELYRLADGHVWQIGAVPLTDPETPGYTQTTARDVTELYETNERLRRENEALRATNEKTRLMYERLADRIREQETLELKMRVHNEIGASLIAISSLLEGGSGADIEDRLGRLRRAVSYFGSGRAVPSGTLADARRQAAEMGVELAVDGVLPPSPELEALVAAAARECVTNCVRHARGSRVDVRLTCRLGVYRAVLTNDGRAPDGPIAEGSGLAALRRRVESAGGEMHLCCAPRFALILNWEEPER